MDEELITNKRVSILVPNRNTRSHIIDFLNSVLYQTYPHSLVEIIILDNGSSDGSQDHIRSWYEEHLVENWLGLKLIEKQNNQGIALGYNFAYENCSKKADIVVRAESDVIWEPNLLEQLVNVFVKIPDAGVVAPKGLLHNQINRVEHAARYINWWTGSITNLTPEFLIDCDIVFGSTFAIRKSCIEQLGYFFKPDRFLANELEFCTRIKRIGYRVFCQPTAIAYHKVAQTSSQVRIEKFQYIHRKEEILFHLQYNHFPKKVTCICYIMAYTIKQLLKNKGVYPFLGVFDGLVAGMLHIERRLPGQKNGQILQVGEWILGNSE